MKECAAMTDDELIDHAQRLYDLAASRVGSRMDLIHLRDLVPDLLERLRSPGQTEVLGQDDVQG
ncbi:hypothetical protein L284_18035 [Novosphingobium lindaniclasticum LE124]|uniref:Uncharacterized protein n=2 Tax=Novosphingobium TaxID=165696 RepID=T0H0Z8_9SPHN|nr:hypothetical protein L284_18035 [Novosphingobium lindaniclasticum LE124]